MTRPGYKMTEIGEIPEEWELARLGSEKVSLCLKSGSTPLKREKDYWNGDIPFVTQSDMTMVDHYLCETSKKITEFGLKSSNLVLVSKNSILLSMYGTIGKVVVNKIPVTVSQNISAIILNNKNANVDYLYYVIQQFSSQFKKQVKTITLKHLDNKIVKSAIIPLPSLHEQQKIAEILSAVDEAIQRVNDQITHTERLKKGLMQTLLTKGIGHTKFKMTEVGEIPEEWKIKSLKDSCSRITDGSHYSPQGTKVGTRLIATVFNMGNDRINTETCKRISDKDYDLLVKSGCKPDNGDVLFSKDGTVGICFPYFQKDELVLLSSIAILKPYDFLDSTYLSYFLKSENGMRQIIGLRTGSALKRVTLKNLKLVKIPFPFYEEQQKIAQILSTVDNKLGLLRNKKEFLEKLKRGLMGDLLTGKVRVKLSASRSEN